MLEFVRAYPVSVVIAERRGKGIQWSFDKARRIIRDDGTQAYRLKKNKKNIPPPDYSFLHLGKKGNTILPLFSPQEGQFVAMDVENPIPKLKIEDKEVTFWNILETRRTHEIYPKKMGFMEKYATFIAIGLVLACSTRYRLPEPSRLAHQMVGRVKSSGMPR